MPFDICLFDLDGTLTDSKLGITKSVRYSLSSFGIDAPDPDKLTKFIGPPLSESFRNYYHLSSVDTETAIKKYREYYSETGIFENTMFHDVPELLKLLKNHGKVISLATSKPTVFANKILEHFKIIDYFVFVAGSEPDGTRSRKSEVILHALDNIRPKKNMSAVIIGDREHDIIGAKEAGIYSIGVTYGYGLREELELAGADFIVDSIASLPELIL